VQQTSEGELSFKWPTCFAKNFGHLNLVSLRAEHFLRLLLIALVPTAAAATLILLCLLLNHTLPVEVQLVLPADSDIQISIPGFHLLPARVGFVELLHSEYHRYLPRLLLLTFLAIHRVLKFESVF